MTRHIWVWAFQNNSHKSAGFPQIETLIHSFPQVIHRLVGWKPFLSGQAAEYRGGDTQFKSDIKVELSRQESLLNAARPIHPTLRDVALLRLGNALIYLGQRLRNASVINQPADLSQECA